MRIQGKNENVYGKHFIVESYCNPTSRVDLSIEWHNAFMLRLKIQHFSGKPEVFPCSQENAHPSRRLGILLQSERTGSGIS